MATVRFLWVALLLVPAGVVFVATKTTLEPIARTERVEVAPRSPAAVTLPTPAVGITITPRPARVVHPPRPVDVLPKTVVTHIVGVVTVSPQDHGHN